MYVNTNLFSCLAAATFRHTSLASHSGTFDKNTYTQIMVTECLVPVVGCAAAATQFFPLSHFLYHSFFA